MCYSTRIVRKSQEMELFFNVTKLLGKTTTIDELIYFHTNGFSHPLMWIIPQEKREHMTPAMWGLMPQNKLGADHKEYYKESVKFGAGLNAQSEKLFDHC